MEINLEDLRYIKNRMKKYSDLPMDLADASLMCIAERKGVERIISIDSDFSIYKTLKGKFLQNLLKV
ncbi:toxin-antitoxin system, toxin component, PIN family [Leptospira interrogans serovar Valbuzzi str. Duyster]|nr:toxin-antitoxin system, toxin component, PIN family [Leptospira interrogans serovar Valbuzzi str. Duyster]